MAMELRYGVVVDNNDPLGINRVQVASPEDNMLGKEVKKRAWALPGMPQLFKVTPKVGELVYVFYPEGSSNKDQLYYIGPLIGPPEQLYMAADAEVSKYYRTDNQESEQKSSEINPNTLGCFGNKEDVAIYGRKNADIILGDDYATIRCGARELDESGTHFNINDPSFLLLKKEKGKESTATLVAENITLLSYEAIPMEPQNEKNNPSMITDEKLDQLIRSAHELPYGDVLVDFLEQFVDVFMNHYHTYPGLPPDPKSERNINLQNRTNGLSEEMLSPNIRIGG